MAEYTDALVRKGYARGTIDKKVGLLRGWLAWIGPRWTLAGWRDVDAYGDTRRVCKSTWTNEISHISHFYRWAMKCEYAQSDPTLLVQRPTVSVRLPRPASSVHYLRLLDGASPQMLAIIELMAWSGVRCCEVARLKWSDIDLVEHVALVHGKGDRERHVGLTHQGVQALAAIDCGDGYVIKSKRGRRYTPNQISQLVSAWCRHQRVPVTAHMLRHRFATEMLDAAEGDMTVVRDAMGHANISTTEIYAQASRRRAKNAARRLDCYSTGRLFE